MLAHKVGVCIFFFDVDSVLDSRLLTSKKMKANREKDALGNNDDNY